MNLSERGFSDTAQTERTELQASSPARRIVSSDQLLDGTKEMVILHDGHEYVLRLTRQNKLILTK
ncbi:hemin uptake protein HemP [Pseudomonas sp. FIP_A4]|uniref:hemin uptake protein HemP n=1 Tax=Pseudomonas sp. FIP_A4 TaxID=3070684 RepID=UPI000988F4B3|nr:hypothetical protein BSR09_10675 [Stutzerimonas degradans]